MAQDPPLPFYQLAGVKVWRAEEWFPTKSMQGAQVAFHPRDRSQVTGIAIHHDAVAFDGADKNFNGQTWDEEKTRMGASYNWHTKHYPGFMPGGAFSGWNWPGMGYHHYVFPSGRVYEVGRLSTVRAHVAHRNTPLAGVVMAGDFSTNRPQLGTLLAAALSCLYLWTWAGRNLAVKGHRQYAVPGWETSCPGDTYRWSVPQIIEAATVLSRRPEVDPDVAIRAALTPTWNAGDWQFLHDQLRYIGFH